MSAGSVRRHESFRTLQLGSLADDLDEHFTRITKAPDLEPVADASRRVAMQTVAAPPPKTAVKRCKRCGEDKPLDDFPPAPSHHKSPDGRQSICRACFAEWTRAWRAAARATSNGSPAPVVQAAPAAVAPIPTESSVDRLARRVNALLDENGRLRRELSAARDELDWRRSVDVSLEQLQQRIDQALGGEA